MLPRSLISIKLPLKMEEERELTRVDVRTFFKRGKSLIPESRIEIEESRRVREFRSEETDAVREVRDCDVFWVEVYAILIVTLVKTGE